MTIARSIASAIAKPIAEPVASVGGGGTRALDIRASVGTSTSPTSTGTKAVTGVGFQPKVVLPFGIAVETVGAFTEAGLGFGAGTSSTNRASIGVSSRNGVTTSASARRHDNSKVYYPLFQGSNTFEIADLSSLDADGFTLNWNPKDTSARLLHSICLGGADLEVSLTQQQMNGTNAAQSFAHGLSGAPTGVLFFGFNNISAPPFTTTSLYMALGAWASGNQFGALLHSLNGVTTTTTRRALFSNAVGGFTDAAIQRTMAVSSVDATNVNVTYPVTIATSQVYIWMLAIRGAKCQVGTFDDVEISTPGITPKLFFFAAIPAFTGAVQNDLELTLGASDGTNNVSCGITDRNGVTTTNARRFQSSTTLCRFDTTGTKASEGTASFSGESIVLDYSTGSALEGGYLVIGS